MALLTCAALALPCGAQVRAGATLTNTAGQLAQTIAPRWQPKKREAHSTEWISVRRITNAATGRVRSVTNSYIELATALNVRGADGRWRPASPAFTITANGAEALGTVHRVRLAPDIGTIGSVTVQKGDVTLQSHPLCIGYFDPVDGRSVRLADITSAVGWLVKSNEVVYSNCFNGLRASIRYRNSKAGIEQDLIMHERPAFTPEDLGLSPLTRLELFTEFVGDTPMPERSDQVLEPERDSALRQQMREPDFADSTLTFGSRLRMAQGNAFITGGPAQPGRTRGKLEGARVGKRFEIIDGRKILIEAVPHRRVRDMLTNLPLARVAGIRTNAAVAPPRSRSGELAFAAVNGQKDVSHPERKAVSEVSSERQFAATRLHAQIAASRTLPAPRPALKTDVRIQSAAASPSPLGVPHNPQSAIAIPQSPDIAFNNPQSASRIPQSATPPSPAPPAFIMDYEAFNYGAYDAFTFRSDMTYLCSGIVDFGVEGGTIVIEPGTCIKYDEFDSEGNPAVACFQIYGPIDCRTEPYRPAFFTSIYDNSVGEVIDTSQSPGRYLIAMALNNYQQQQLKHLRISYAQYGLATAFQGMDLRHSQFTHCDNAVYPQWSQWYMGNVLAWDVSTFINGISYSLTAEHATVDNCGTLIHDNWGIEATWGQFKNSLFTDVSGLGNVSCNVAENELISSSGVYQSAGSGSHYLAENSPHRDAGTEAIDPSLLAELRARTTRPPLAVASPVQQPTTLGSRTLQDDGQIDRGYHYEILDWLASGVNVQGNNTLNVTGGAVVGVDNSAATYGIHLESYGKLLSEGTPLALNQFVLGRTVQEGGAPMQPWTRISIFADSPPVMSAELHLRFTDIPLIAGPYWHVFEDNIQGGLRHFGIRDTQLRGGRLNLSPPSPNFIGWTNSLFEGVQTTIYPYAPITFHARNNLFKDGTLTFAVGMPPGYVLSAKDNLFDRTVIWQSPYLTIEHDHNAYIQGRSTLTGAPGPSDVTLSDAPGSPPYETGPLGNYYLLPTLNGQPNPMINGGSRPADQAGLYHFTTATNQVKETNSVVDIGPHWVALDSNGNAIDTDGDGLPDYSEDVNGNGTVDPGETSFHDPVLTLTPAMNYLRGNPAQLIGTNATLLPSH